MRLPLLLLSVCVLAFATSEKVSHDGSEEGMGKPTVQNKQPLEQSWTSLFEDAIDRLEHIFTNNNNNNKTVERGPPNGTNEIPISELGKGNDLFEGDIILPRRERLSNNRWKRQVHKYAQKWPQNTLYYAFDANVGVAKRTTVKNAVAEWQRRTCVNFVENPNAQYRVQISNGNGCASALGFQGGVQQMTLQDGCGTVMGTVAHEFGHALGLIHTQSRMDRDNYINYNVKGTGGFNDQNKKTEIYYFTPYEYGSIMHYPIDLYGTQADALVPKDRRYDYTLGGKFITFYDVMAINDFYECGGCARCKNGGVQSIRDCAVCECPAGFGGKFCDQRPETCGSTLEATKEWQEEVITVGSGTTVRDDYDFCNTWITAPKGSLIEVKIVNMTNPNCNYGCTLNGIEIKGDKDSRITNPRYCCPESVGTLVQSYQNPTPIITHARAGSATFKIRYRYSIECADGYPSFCASEPNYCTSDASFREKKYRCGVTCGLCGQKDPVCEDDPSCKAALEYHTCDQLLQGAYEPVDLEFFCGKSCGYCGNATTTTSTTTTTTTTAKTTTKASNSTSTCQEQNACETVYSDIVDGSEKHYFCGNNCWDCINLEICEDSQFCAKLMKESGAETCDSLFKYLDYNRDLMDLYCYKSCSYLC